MDETDNFSIYQACNAETVLSVVSNYKMCPHLFIIVIRVMKY